MIRKLSSALVCVILCVPSSYAISEGGCVVISQKNDDVKDTKVVFRKCYPEWYALDALLDESVEMACCLMRHHEALMQEWHEDVSVWRSCPCTQQKRPFFVKINQDAEWVTVSLHSVEINADTVSAELYDDRACITGSLKTSGSLVITLSKTNVHVEVQQEKAEATDRQESMMQNTFVRTQAFAPIDVEAMSVVVHDDMIEIKAPRKRAQPFVVKRKASTHNAESAPSVIVSDEK